MQLISFYCRQIIFIWGQTVRFYMDYRSVSNALWLNLAFQDTLIILSQQELKNSSSSQERLPDFLRLAVRVEFLGLHQWDRQNAHAMGLHLFWVISKKQRSFVYVLRFFWVSVKPHKMAAPGFAFLYPQS